jgi:guanylate kinase
MFVLSSPSGAGKSTLARRLLAEEDNLQLSVSVTTRAARPSEIEGKDYFFETRKSFDARVKSGDFLEHAEVFGNCYGTPRGPVEDALAAGQDVLFDIDWQGAQQLERSARDDLVRVFILPPSREELERRLIARAQDSADVVAKRMAKASDELSHWAEYDYVIVNDNLDSAHARVRSILEAERLRRQRQIGLTDFVTKLRSGM